MDKCYYCGSQDVKYCNLCKKHFCEKCSKKYGKRFMDMVKEKLG